jgi:hypothetical protein
MHTEALFYTKLMLEKKISSKYTQLGSSFEALIARNTMVRSDFNLDARFENYSFLKF